MKIILCPDSFKDSLTSSQICDITTKIIKKHIPHAEVISIPLSDGGEGFCVNFTHAVGGSIVNIDVHNACNQLVSAKLGIYDDTAVIEIAEACGLHKTPVESRNPLFTSSYGVGEMITHVLNLGLKRIIIGLGGSATNDGGIGMLAALGVKIYTTNGVLNNTADYIGKQLNNIVKVDLSGIDSRLANTTLVVACDVNNYLLGEFGATHVFGRQKGANDKDIKILEAGMCNYCNVVKLQYNLDLNKIVGGGAAGGLGATLIGILKAQMVSGIDLMLTESKFSKHLEDSDLVITGEGSIDQQTLYGKVVLGVAKLCKVNKIPCIVFTGSADDSVLSDIYHDGVSAIIPILRNVTTLEEALIKAKDNLYYAVDNFLRIFIL